MQGRKMSIKRWLRNWLMNDESKLSKAETGIQLSSDDPAYDNYRNQIRFNVQPARGGLIVTVKQYDPKRDENNHTVHIIHDDQNVAENIAHIVSMELLRS